MASWLRGWESQNTRPPKKISNLSEVWILNKVQLFSESVYIFFTQLQGARIHSLGSCKSRTHGVDPWSIHRFQFMVNAAKKAVYTPWVNAMSAAFTRIESDRKRFLTYLKYEYWKRKRKKKKNSWRRDSNPRPSTILTDSEASSFTAALLRHMLT